MGDIFEDENLFKITILSENDEKGKPGTKHEEGAKQAMDCKSTSYKPKSAFLGPKIWEKPISMSLLQGIKDEKHKEETYTNHNSNVEDFSVMTLNDFLEENQLEAGNISPSISEGLF